MLDPARTPHPITWLDSRGTRTGTWRAARPVYVQQTSPCREACPAGEDIPRWIDQLRGRRFREAWEVLVEDNPFPAVMGHVCIHPCQGSCNRREHDGCMGIASMEEFLGNRAIAEGWPLPAPSAERPQAVAVVGGGPAGLSCAYQLRRLGYRVTLFEAAARLGGNLRHALPDFQLPVAVVEAEVQRIVDLGITVHTGVRVGADRPWAALLDAFDAVFIASGAPVISGAGLPGADRPGVVDGLRFLQALRAGELPSPRRAVVVGCGLTGIEAARALVRLGAAVTVVTAEARERIDTLKRAEEAEAEGAVLLTGATVQAILGAATGGDGVRTAADGVRTATGGDAGAAAAPVTGVQLADRVLPADLVVLATGRMADLADLPDDAEVDERYALAADPFTGATNMAGVFAGGDLTGTRYAAAAVGSGKRAAAAIHAYLQGQDPATALAPARLGYSPNLSMRYFARPESYPPHLQVRLQKVVSYPEIQAIYFDHRPRHYREWLPLAERSRSFRLARRAYTEAEALAESQRCFSCGTCIGCDNCLLFCPDMAISKRADGGGFDINWDYCKGCGACVQECPRAALVLAEEVK